METTTVDTILLVDELIDQVKAAAKYFETKQYRDAITALELAIEAYKELGLDANDGS